MSVCADSLVVYAAHELTLSSADAEHKFEEMEKEMSSMLDVLAINACAYMHHERYMSCAYMHHESYMSCAYMHHEEVHVIHGQSPIPYSSKFSRSKTSVIQPAQTTFFAPIDMPIGLNIFMDKIFVIHLHLTKITKFIDLENLELYGMYMTSWHWQVLEEPVDVLFGLELESIPGENLQDEGCQ